MGLEERILDGALSQPRDEIKVVTGRDIYDCVDMSDLKRFVETLYADTFDDPATISYNTRMHVEKLQAAGCDTNVHNKVHSRFNSDLVDGANYLAGRIFGGHLAVVTVNDKPAATASLDAYGRMEGKDRNTVYQIQKVVTLPEFRGRGFATRAMQAMFDRIQVAGANSSRMRTMGRRVRVRTKSSAVKRFCSGIGWKEIDPVTDYKIWEAGRNSLVRSEWRGDKKWLPRSEEWRTYLFDPEPSGDGKYF